MPRGHPPISSPFLRPGLRARLESCLVIFFMTAITVSVSLWTPRARRCSGVTASLGSSSCKDDMLFFIIVTVSVSMALRAAGTSFGNRVILRAAR